MTVRSRSRKGTGITGPEDEDIGRDGELESDFAGERPRSAMASISAFVSVMSSGSKGLSLGRGRKQ